LIRLAACTFVLLFHCFPLTGTSDPIQPMFEITLGMVGVMILFGVSGFLVSASWFNDSRVRAYFVKRGLRIFPGLIASLIITAFLIGPVVTSLSVGDYLTHPTPYLYVLKGSFLDTFSGRLPGVFESNPFPDVVNGSLWTVPIEWCCYIAVAGAAITRAFRHRWLLVGILLVLFVAMVVVAPPIDASIAPEDQQNSFLLMLLPCGSFLTGVLMFLWRQNVRLYPWTLAVALAILPLPLPAGLHIGLEMIAVPYAAIHLGLRRPGRVAVLVRPGDVSYGVYVYAYPLQQSLAQGIAGLAPATMFALTFPIAWLMGFVSWHWLEHPALQLKRRFAGTRGLARRPGDEGAGPAGASPIRTKALDQA
jgi:peptidoglycan/LPS O-acetylase OafA/YrhL